MSTSYTPTNPEAEQKQIVDELLALDSPCSDNEENDKKLRDILRSGTDSCIPFPNTSVSAAEPSLICVDVHPPLIDDKNKPQIDSRVILTSQAPSSPPLSEYKEATTPIDSIVIAAATVVPPTLFSPVSSPPSLYSPNPHSPSPSLPLHAGASGSSTLPSKSKLSQHDKPRPSWFSTLFSRSPRPTHSPTTTTSPDTSRALELPSPAFGRVPSPSPSLDPLTYFSLGSPHALPPIQAHTATPTQIQVQPHSALSTAPSYSTVSHSRDPHLHTQHPPHIHTSSQSPQDLYFSLPSVPSPPSLPAPSLPPLPSTSSSPSPCSPDSPSPSPSSLTSPDARLCSLLAPAIAVATLQRARKAGFTLPSPFSAPHTPSHMSQHTPSDTQTVCGTNTHADTMMDTQSQRENELPSLPSDQRLSSVTATLRSAETPRYAYTAALMLPQSLCSDALRLPPATSTASSTSTSTTATASAAITSTTSTVATPGLAATSTTASTTTAAPPAAVSAMAVLERARALLLAYSRLSSLGARAVATALPALPRVVAVDVSGNGRVGSAAVELLKAVVGADRWVEGSTEERGERWRGEKRQNVGFSENEDVCVFSGVSAESGCVNERYGVSRHAWRSALATAAMGLCYEREEREHERAEMVRMQQQSREQKNENGKEKRKEKANNVEGRDGAARVSAKRDNMRTRGSGDGDCVAAAAKDGREDAEGECGFVVVGSVEDGGDGADSDSDGGSGDYAESVDTRLGTNDSARVGKTVEASHVGEERTNRSSVGGSGVREGTHMSGARAPKRGGSAGLVRISSEDGVGGEDKEQEERAWTLLVTAATAIASEDADDADGADGSAVDDSGDRGRGLCVVDVSGCNINVNSANGHDVLHEVDVDVRDGDGGVSGWLWRTVEEEGSCMLALLVDTDTHDYNTTSNSNRSTNTTSSSTGAHSSSAKGAGAMQEGSFGYEARLRALALTRLAAMHAGASAAGAVWARACPCHRHGHRHGHRGRGDDCPLVNDSNTIAAAGSASTSNGSGDRSISGDDNDRRNTFAHTRVSACGNDEDSSALQEPWMPCMCMLPMATDAAVAAVQSATMALSNGYVHGNNSHGGVSNDSDGKNNGRSVASNSSKSRSNGRPGASNGSARACLCAVTHAPPPGHALTAYTPLPSSLPYALHTLAYNHSGVGSPTPTAPSTSSSPSIPSSSPCASSVPSSPHLPLLLPALTPSYFDAFARAMRGCVVNERKWSRLCAVHDESASSLISSSSSALSSPSLDTSASAAEVRGPSHHALLRVYVDELMCFLSSTLTHHATHHKATNAAPAETPQGQSKTVAAVRRSTRRGVAHGELSGTDHDGDHEDVGGVGGIGHDKSFSHNLAPSLRSTSHPPCPSISPSLHTLSPHITALWHRLSATAATLARATARTLAIPAARRPPLAPLLALGHSFLRSAAVAVRVRAKGYLVLHHTLAMLCGDDGASGVVGGAAGADVAEAGSDVGVGAAAHASTSIHPLPSLPSLPRLPLSHSAPCLAPLFALLHTELAALSLLLLPLARLSHALHSLLADMLARAALVGASSTALTHNAHFGEGPASMEDVVGSAGGSVRGGVGVGSGAEDDAGRGVGSGTTTSAGIGNIAGHGGSGGGGACVREPPTACACVSVCDAQGHNLPLPAFITHAAHATHMHTPRTTPIPCVCPPALMLPDTRAAVWVWSWHAERGVQAIDAVCGGVADRTLSKEKETLRSGKETLPSVQRTLDSVGTFANSTSTSTSTSTSPPSPEYSPSLPLATFLSSPSTPSTPATPMTSSSFIFSPRPLLPAPLLDGLRAALLADTIQTRMHTAEVLCSIFGHTQASPLSSPSSTPSAVRPALLSINTSTSSTAPSLLSMLTPPPPLSSEPVPTYTAAVARRASARVLFSHLRRHAAKRTLSCCLPHHASSQSSFSPDPSPCFPSSTSSSSPSSFFPQVLCPLRPLLRAHIHLAASLAASLAAALGRALTLALDAEADEEAEAEAEEGERVLSGGERAGERGKLEGIGGVKHRDRYRNQEGDGGRGGGRDDGYADDNDSNNDDDEDALSAFLSPSNSHSSTSSRLPHTSPSMLRRPSRTVALSPSLSLTHNPAPSVPALLSSLNALSRTSSLAHATLSPSLPAVPVFPILVAATHALTLTCLLPLPLVLPPRLSRDAALARSAVEAGALLSLPDLALLSQWAGYWSQHSEAVHAAVERQWSVEILPPSPSSEPKAKVNAQAEVHAEAGVGVEVGPSTIPGADASASPGAGKVEVADVSVRPCDGWLLQWLHCALTDDKDGIVDGLVDGDDSSVCACACGKCYRGTHTRVPPASTSISTSTTSTPCSPTAPLALPLPLQPLLPSYAATHPAPSAKAALIPAPPAPTSTSASTPSPSAATSTSTSTSGSFGSAATSISRVSRIDRPSSPPSPTPSRRTTATHTNTNANTAATAPTVTTSNSNSNTSTNTSTSTSAGAAPSLPARRSISFNARTSTAGFTQLSRMLQDNEDTAVAYTLQHTLPLVPLLPQDTTSAFASSDVAATASVSSSSCSSSVVTLPPPLVSPFAPPLPSVLQDTRPSSHAALANDNNTTTMPTTTVSTTDTTSSTQNTTTTTIVSTSAAPPVSLAIICGCVSVLPTSLAFAAAQHLQNISTTTLRPHVLVSHSSPMALLQFQPAAAEAALLAHTLALTHARRVAPQLHLLCTNAFAVETLNTGVAATSPSAHTLLSPRAHTDIHPSTLTSLTTLTAATSAASRAHLASPPFSPRNLCPHPTLSSPPLSSLLIDVLHHCHTLVHDVLGAARMRALVASLARAGEHVYVSEQCVQEGGVERGTAGDASVTAAHKPVSGGHSDGVAVAGVLADSTSSSAKQSMSRGKAIDVLRVSSATAQRVPARRRALAIYGFLSPFTTSPSTSASAFTASASASAASLTHACPPSAVLPLALTVHACIRNAALTAAAEARAHVSTAWRRGWTWEGVGGTCWVLGRVNACVLMLGQALEVAESLCTALDKWEDSYANSQKKYPMEYGTKVFGEDAVLMRNATSLCADTAVHPEVMHSSHTMPTPTMLSHSYCDACVPACSRSPALYVCDAYGKYGVGIANDTVACLAGPTTTCIRRPQETISVRAVDVGAAVAVLRADTIATRRPDVVDGVPAAVRCGCGEGPEKQEGPARELAEGEGRSLGVAIGMGMGMGMGTNTEIGNVPLCSVPQSVITHSIHTHIVNTPIVSTNPSISTTAIIMNDDTNAVAIPAAPHASIPPAPVSTSTSIAKSMSATHVAPVSTPQIPRKGKQAHTQTTSATASALMQLLDTLDPAGLGSDSSSDDDVNDGDLHPAAAARGSGGGIGRPVGAGAGRDHHGRGRGRGRGSVAGSNHTRNNDTTDVSTTVDAPNTRTNPPPRHHRDRSTHSARATLHSNQDDGCDAVTPLSSPPGTPRSARETLTLYSGLETPPRGPRTPRKGSQTPQSARSRASLYALTRDSPSRGTSRWSRASSRATHTSDGGSSRAALTYDHAVIGDESLGLMDGRGVENGSLLGGASSGDGGRRNGGSDIDDDGDDEDGFIGLVCADMLHTHTQPPLFTSTAIHHIRTTDTNPLHSRPHLMAGTMVTANRDDHFRAPTHSHSYGHQHSDIQTSVIFSTAPSSTRGHGEVHLRGHAAAEVADRNNSIGIATRSGISGNPDAGNGMFPGRLDVPENGFFRSGFHQGMGALGEPNMGTGIGTRTDNTMLNMGMEMPNSRNFIFPNDSLPPTLLHAYEPPHHLSFYSPDPPSPSLAPFSVGATSSLDMGSYQPSLVASLNVSAFVRIVGAAMPSTSSPARVPAPTIRATTLAGGGVDASVVMSGPARTTTTTPSFPVVSTTQITTTAPSISSMPSFPHPHGQCTADLSRTHGRDDKRGYTHGTGLRHTLGVGSGPSDQHEEGQVRQHGYQGEFDSGYMPEDDAGNEHMGGVNIQDYSGTILFRTEIPEPRPYFHANGDCMGARMNMSAGLGASMGVESVGQGCVPPSTTTMSSSLPSLVATTGTSPHHLLITAPAPIGVLLSLHARTYIDASLTEAYLSTLAANTSLHTPSALRALASARANAVLMSVTRGVCCCAAGMRWRARRMAEHLTNVQQVPIHPPANTHTYSTSNSKNNTILAVNTSGNPGMLAPTTSGNPGFQLRLTPQKPPHKTYTNAGSDNAHPPTTPCRSPQHTQHATHYAQHHAQHCSQSSATQPPTSLLSSLPLPRAGQLEGCICVAQRRDIVAALSGMNISAPLVTLASHSFPHPQSYTAARAYGPVNPSIPLTTAATTTTASSAATPAATATTATATSAAPSSVTATTVSYPALPATTTIASLFLSLAAPTLHLLRTHTTLFAASLAAHLAGTLPAIPSTAWLRRSLVHPRSCARVVVSCVDDALSAMLEGLMEERAPASAGTSTCSCLHVSTFSGTCGAACKCVGTCMGNGTEEHVRSVHVLGKDSFSGRNNTSGMTDIPSGIGNSSSLPLPTPSSRRLTPTTVSSAIASGISSAAAGTIGLEEYIHSRICTCTHAGAHTAMSTRSCVCIGPCTCANIAVPSGLGNFVSRNSLSGLGNSQSIQPSRAIPCFCRTQPLPLSLARLYASEWLSSVARVCVRGAAELAVARAYIHALVRPVTDRERAVDKAMQQSKKSHSDPSTASTSTAVGGIGDLYPPDEPLSGLVDATHVRVATRLREDAAALEGFFCSLREEPGFLRSSGSGDGGMGGLSGPMGGSSGVVTLIGERSRLLSAVDAGLVMGEGEGVGVLLLRTIAAFIEVIVHARTSASKKEGVATGDAVVGVVIPHFTDIITILRTLPVLDETSVPAVGSPPRDSSSSGATSLSASVNTANDGSHVTTDLSCGAWITVFRVLDRLLRIADYSRDERVRAMQGICAAFSQETGLHTMDKVTMKKIVKEQTMW